MANAVALFQPGSMPAHIVEAQENTNIVPRSTVNALTFEGKAWTINLDGKKTRLTKTNSEGETENVQIFTGIILDYTKDRGREFYAGKYDPKKPSAPDCWSEDGKKPHENVALGSKVSLTCATCPNAKKGSATTQDGKGTVACSQFRKIALIPAAKLGGFPPLRMRIKITSDYDKEGQDKHPDWYGFQQYLDFLVSNGVRFTGSLPTKIKFDNTAYPKLLFAPGKAWLDQPALDLVKEMAQSEAVKELLAQTYSPQGAGTKALPEDEEEETEVEAAAVPAQAAPRKAKPAPVTTAGEDDDGDPAGEAAPAPQDDDDAPEQTAEQIAAAKRAAAKTVAVAATQAATQKATQKAAAARQASVEAADDDDDNATVMPPTKPTKPVAAAATAGKQGKPSKAPTAPVDAPPEVADILEGWDD